MFNIRKEGRFSRLKYIVKNKIIGGTIPYYFIFCSIMLIAENTLYYIQGGYDEFYRIKK